MELIDLSIRPFIVAEIMELVGSIIKQSSMASLHLWGKFDDEITDRFLVAFDGPHIMGILFLVD